MENLTEIYIQHLEDLLNIIYKDPLLTIFLICMGVVTFALYIVLKVVAT